MPKHLLSGLILMASSAMVGAEGVTSASYDDPTDRYAHGVLGDAIEYGSLVLRTDTGRNLRIVLPEDRVFEDLEPRLVDVDLDGDMEVVVVETQARVGAQLAIYDPTGKIAATPHIGQTNRWLAPIGAADMDGDGRVEIAYIDRPHLAKTLRVWRFEDSALTEVANRPGLTNHRIGEDFISGGLRTCAGKAEMVVATGNWSGLVAVTLSNNSLSANSIPGTATPAGFAAALTCAN